MAMNAGIRRRLSTGTNASIVTVLLAAAAALAVEMAARADLRLDLSADARSTLTSELETALGRASDRGVDVEIIAFSRANQGEDTWYRDRVIKDLLNEMDARSPRVSTRFVDLDADRLTAENLGVKQYGTLIVRTRDDRVDIADRDLFTRRAKDTSVFVGEGRLVAAITEVLSDRRRRLYALVGHGERTLFRQGQGELVAFSELVRDLGYDVRPLELLESKGAPQVPPDASALVVVRPTVPLTPTENDAIADYLQDGGRAALFVDPGYRLPAFAERLGLEVQDGIVLDEEFRYPDPMRPHLRFGRHPTTADLASDPPVLVDVLRVAPISATAEAWRSTHLLTTSRRGWIERGSELVPAYTQGRDAPGPVVAAVALDGPRGARVVAVGDSDLLTDPFLETGPGNATFVANILRWIVGAEDQISPLRPSRPSRPLVLSTEERTRLRTALSLLWPLCWIAVGAVVVWRRRRS